MLFRKMLGTKSVIGFLLVVTLPGISSIILAQGNCWTTKAPMPTARLNLAACVLNGKIYAIGGVTGQGMPGLKIVEEYDPVNDSWTSKADMATGRAGLSASTVNGKIYAIGGATAWGGTCLSSIEEYDPETDTWTTKSSMQIARANLSTCTLNGKIYAIGGAKSQSEVWAEVEEYDPETNTWTMKAALPTPIGFLSTNVMNGKIYAIGGATFQGISSKVELYDPVTNSWSDTTVANMQTARGALSSSVINMNIYVFGGVTSNFSSPISTLEKYDPATNTWTKKTNMPKGRSFLSTGAVDGKVYIIGGSLTAAPSVSPTDAVEEYDPAADSLAATSIENRTAINPASFVLYQNYPNPFNPETNIRYVLSNPVHVMLQIINILGQEVCILVDEERPAGLNEATWKGKDKHDRLATSGVYFYKLETKDFVQMNKMILVR